MKKLVNAIKIVVFFLLIIGMVYVAQNITEKKTAVEKYNDFFDVADQVDVLFLGSSHMLNSINPIQLYRDFGITSYNMAKPSGIVTESYWQLMNTLDYCDPKLVVIDLWALDRDYQYLNEMEDFRSDADRRNSVSSAHEHLDIWPLSKTKISAVKDLISDNKLRAELLWPFIIYHDRWSSLTSADFTEAFEVKSSKYLMGAEAQSILYTSDARNRATDETLTLTHETVCYQYLKKVIDECEARNIQVAFTFMPMAQYFNEDVMAVNSAEALAKEHGIKYYWFLNHDDLTIINFTTDMYDGTHLNNLGMFKMTYYLGTQLINDFNLADHRGESGYDIWNQNAIDWTNSLKEIVVNGTDFYNELRNIEMTASNVVIFMGGDSMAMDDHILQAYIKQLSGSNGIDEAKATNNPYLLVLDRTVSGKTYELAGKQSVTDDIPLLGNVAYIGASNFGAIYPNGDYEQESLLDMNSHYYDDMHIMIFDENGEYVKTIYYDLFVD